MRATDHVLDYVDAYLFDALDATEAEQVAVHCERCSVCKVALEEARRRQAALESLPVCEASELLIRTTLNRIDGQQTQRIRRKRWSVRIIATALAASVLFLGGANLYYHNLKASPFDLEILGQKELLAGSPGSLRVRVLNRATGQPVPNVPVNLTLRNAEASVLLCMLTTDAEGTGTPRFQVPDWAAGNCTLHADAQVSWRSTEKLQQPVRLKRSAKVMLSSDKPVYQPGQDIRLRALTLRQPDLKPVAEEPATLTITDPKGNLIFKKSALTSGYGILAADCPLASEVLEGAYAIACKVGDTESKLTVEVKKYVLPKFKVELDLTEPYYQPGQQVAGTVKAGYFFGKPVAEGEVELAFQTNTNPPVHLSGQRLRLDAQGEVKFTLQLPKNLPGTETHSGDTRLQVKALVTDSAGQKQERTATRIVTTLALRIEIIPEAGELVLGVANRIHVFTSYPDGRPARAKLRVGNADGMHEVESNALGTATVEVTPTTPTVAFAVEATDAAGKRGRRHEVLTCGDGYEDFLVRTDRVVYDSGATVHLDVQGGGTQPVFVDFIKDGQTVLTQAVPVANGTGQLAFDLPPDLFGTVELCSYRFLGSGLPLRKTRLLYVRPADQVRIATTLDRDEYRPGTKAKLRFNLTDPKGKAVPGALSVAAVDEAVYAVLEQAPGMEKIFYTLEQQRMKPVFALYPWSPDLSTAENDTRQFEQALFARTAWNTRSPIQQPIKGPSPQLHSLFGNSFPDKERQLTLDREQALNLIYRGWIGMGISLLLLGYASLWVVFPTELVWRIHGVVALGFFVLFLLSAILLLATGKVELGVGGSSRSKKFGTVSNIIDGAEADLSQRLAMPKSAAKSVPPPTTRPAAGREPSVVQASEPVSVGTGSAPVRVRQWFAETLLWRPELITDDKGEATLDVELADSITTWRLSASAVTADGRLGAMQRPLKVFQPFFVDLNLPVTLTRGDEVGIPVVVYNYLNKPQTVELTFEAGNWFTSLDDAVQRLDLQSGEVRSVLYRIRVARVGQHHLQVTARGSGVADAIRREIEVVADGRRVEQVSNGILHQPAEVAVQLPGEAIDGSARLVLKLYPTNFSQVVEGLDAIFRMPSGCFEQTSSTTYPNVLALDYLHRTGKTMPEVEAKARQYIHLGYQRLLSFEVQGGGFDWFGRPPANRTLTAYGLMEFQDMARVHDVDSDLIARTRAWLLRQRTQSGAWSAELRMINDGLASSVQRGNPDLGTTAYIAWAVFGGPSTRDSQPTGEGWATQQYLLGHPPEAIADPHVLALVCNALLALDPTGRDAGPYLDRLQSLSRTAPDGKRLWWEQPSGGRTIFHGAGRAGSIETTALALLALHKAGRSAGVVQSALAWLIEQKDGQGTWHSTQATVLALKALVATAGQSGGNERERRLEVRLGAFSREVVIPADQADVMQFLDLTPHLRPGLQQLTILERTQTAPSYQVTFRYHVPGTPVKSQRDPLTVQVTYDRVQLAVGDVVTARARVVNEQAATAPMVMLDLPIPAGFVPDAQELNLLQASGQIAKFQMTGRSVLVYLRGLEPKNPLTLTYRLRATMPVNVAVPGARVYEYYDTDKQGRSEPTRMTATPRP